MTTAAEQQHLQQHGLYDPAQEHDACGVGFVAHIKGEKSHAIVGQALKILENLDHRGAVGAEQLHELHSLRGKNQSVIAHMMRRVDIEKKDHVRPR